MLLPYLLLILTLVLGCSEAKTLGDEDPVEVKLSSLPTWEEGVRELMKIKCATCHRVPHGDLTPEQTPRDLDLRNYEQEGGVRGAKEIISFIKEGILEEDIFVGTPQEVRKMPLDFATPLTDDETQGLLKWANLAAPETRLDIGKSNQIQINATSEELARGAELFDQSSTSRKLACSSCHGPEGNLEGFSPKSPAFLGSNLKASILTGSSLTSKIKQMWENSSFAGHGSGTFSKLTSSDQSALNNYLLSLRASSQLVGTGGASNDTNTGGSSSSKREGKELYQLVGPSNVSCKSCHGPDGNPKTSGFTPLDPSAHQLNASIMSGNELQSKIESMWDFFTARGSGSFKQLSQVEQQNLVDYVASLQVGASSDFSAPHSHADPDSEYTLCVNRGIFDFLFGSSDTLSCHAGTGCGTFDIFDEKQETYQTRVACLQDCNKKAAESAQISECEGVEE